MAVWHVFIPFFYGKNLFVTKKAGAPVDKKVEYLKQTIQSFSKVGTSTKITVYVCDAISEEKALLAHNTVKKINCHPLHLPIESVKDFQEHCRQNTREEDIIVFTEDDQVLYMSASVIEDVLNCNEHKIFSPHRWAQTMLFFRKKGRPVFKFNGRAGVLDNMSFKENREIVTYNNSYVVQEDRNVAYAACWFMKKAVFEGISFNVPAADVMLESPSFAAFESGVPVLKLSGGSNGEITDFIIDHLSGYDYNKRLV